MINLSSDIYLLLACFQGKLTSTRSITASVQEIDLLFHCLSQQQNMNGNLQCINLKLVFVHTWFTKAEIQELSIKCPSWHQSKNETMLLCDHRGRLGNTGSKTLCHGVRIKVIKVLLQSAINKCPADQLITKANFLCYPSNTFNQNI